MNTIEDWFIDHLPADIAAMAISNTSDEVQRLKHPSLSGAIKSAFIWSKSRQGHAFWLQLYETVVEREESIAQEGENKNKK